MPQKPSLWSNPMEASTLLTAFLTGVGTSLHCSLMCGPIACALRVRPVEYHLSRVFSYSLLGAFAGAIGKALSPLLRSTPASIPLWIFLVALFLMASGLEKRIPIPNVLSRSLTRLRLNRSLGLLTPLIPCGPLWLMLGVAATTPSASEGALFLFSFALGTIPLYLLLQSGWQRLHSLIQTSTLLTLQRTTLWCATAIMAWRILSPSPHGCCSL